MEDYSGDALASRNSQRKQSEMSNEDKELADSIHNDSKKAFFAPDPNLMTPDDLIRRQLRQLIEMERIHYKLVLREGTNPTMRTIQLSKYIVDSYGRVYDQMKGRTVNVNTTNVKKWEDDPEMQQLQKMASDYVEKLKKDGRLKRN